MSDDKEPTLYESAAKILSERFDHLVEGLDQTVAMTLVEELVDDYLLAVYGTSVISEFKKIQKNALRGGICFQTIDEGRAILISGRGYIAEQVPVTQGRPTKVMLTQDRTVAVKNDRGPGCFMESPKVPHLERGGYIKQGKGRVK